MDFFNFIPKLLVVVVAFCTIIKARSFSTVNKQGANEVGKTSAGINITAGTLAAPTHVYIAAGRGVRYISLASAEVKIILDLPATAMAYHAQQGKLYLSNVTEIYRANLDGSKVERQIFNDGIVSGLAVDDSTGNLYVTVAAQANGVTPPSSDILVCKTTSSKLSCSTVTSIEGRTYGNPALDPSARTLYLTTHEGQIYRIRMDNGTSEVLYNSGASGGSPGGTQFKAIALDAERSKLYWTDEWADRILTSDLEGKNVTIFLQLPVYTLPYGIVIGGDGRIYWTNGAYETVESCDSSGKDIRTYDTQLGGWITNLALVNRS